MVPIPKLLEKYSEETTVHAVASKAKCQKCGRKGNMEFRLHYVCSPGPNEIRQTEANSPDPSSLSSE